MRATAAMAEQTSETKLPVNDQSSDRLARVMKGLLDVQLKARCCGWTNKAAFLSEVFYMPSAFSHSSRCRLNPHNIKIMHV